MLDKLWLGVRVALVALLVGSLAACAITQDGAQPTRTAEDGNAVREDRYCPRPATAAYAMPGWRRVPLASTDPVFPLYVFPPKGRWWPVARKIEGRDTILLLSSQPRTCGKTRRTYHERGSAICVKRDRFVVQADDILRPAPDEALWGNGAVTDRATRVTVLRGLLYKDGGERSFAVLGGDEADCDRK